VVSTATPTVVACLCRSSGHHHYRRPHCKPASSSSGILKKVGVTKKTKKRQGPLIWKALRSFCMRRRVVSFQDNVRAIAFARTLGCSTVPGDGTLVTVGLGAPLQETHEPLAGVRKPGDRPIESAHGFPALSVCVCSELPWVMQNSSGPGADTDKGLSVYVPCARNLYKADRTV